MRTKEVTIKKGWYWSCGKGRWGQGYSQEGVGLNRELFQDSDKIHVTVGDKTYELDTAQGRSFIRYHNSQGKIGKNRIGYIPRSLMKEI
jgi:hypothetical protein